MSVAENPGQRGGALVRSAGMAQGGAMRRAWLAALALAAGWAQTLEAQPAAVPEEPGFEAKSERLDALFRAAAEGGGSYILDYRLGDRVFSRAYGSLDCAGRTRMTADALFDGGSLTKVFTSAAVFKLVEDGRLKLDDRLGELFRSVPSDKAAITVAQLLAHRSGIPNFIGRDGRPLPESEWAVESYDYAPASRREMLARAWAAPLLFPPGTREEYSNYGYSLLAAAIERASGRSYQSYVHERIFVPAGMIGTGYLLSAARGRSVADQCRGGESWGNPIGRGVWARGVSWNLMGAGGMMTGVQDLQKWNRAMASGALFRPDVYRRFRATYFGPAYRSCGTDATFIGGSNGMTRSLIVHLPLRGESIVSVATRRENPLPAEGALRDAICRP
jgi:CubicO group peptidase (beta-lactamase class C family)